MHLPDFLQLVLVLAGLLLQPDAVGVNGMKNQGSDGGYTLQRQLFFTLQAFQSMGSVLYT